MYICVIQVHVCVNIDAQIYVCLHVCGHTHVGAYVHVWVCIESPGLTLHIFLTYSPWNPLRQGLAIKFRTHKLTILPWKSLFCLPHPRITRGSSHSCVCAASPFPAFLSSETWYVSELHPCCCMSCFIEQINQNQWAFGFTWSFPFKNWATTSLF